MTTAKIKIPPKLIPVFLGPARYRGAYGGRGSAKTRTFAKMSAIRAFQWAEAGEEGVILGGREFMNSLADSSMEEIKAAIKSEPWLEPHFDIGETYIRTRDRRIRYEFVGLAKSLDSIKSKARIKLLWVDEAEPVSADAWEKAIPSVREHDSEVWVTWNPESKRSATHERFRVNPPTGAKIIEMNWRDNPWFPGVLEGERLEDLEKRPDSYEHVWEGGFKTATKGAYYAEGLALAKQQGRIEFLAADPLMTIRAYWDIGGTGAKADATAIWIAQFIGKEIRLLDYYEARHQPLSVHIAWLRKNGYATAYCILPHDGSSGEKIVDTTYEASLRAAGFEVKVIPNQGAGAATMRIEAARRLFPRMRFADKPTEPGRDAIGHYHEKLDDKRDIGLGPNHDWASHGADAFGLVAIDYEEPTSSPDRLEITPFGAV
jgi:phage terminase large subunit